MESSRAEALVLVGHGSRSAASDKEMSSLADLIIRSLPDVAVDLGFLEMSEPPAGVVIDRVVAGGSSRVVVLPLVLLGAGHAKSDVPAIVARARQRHPGVEICFGSPLGVARQLVAILGANLDGAGARGLPLLVIARGTSDPDANGDAAKAGRLLSEWIGASFHLVAFTGVTGPSVPEALRTMTALGHQRIAVAFWFLGTGRLVERAREHLAQFSRQGGTVLDGGYFGPHPDLVPLILDRYQEALEGAPAVNCDACSYRAPWPGLESRVGQAIGVGHSHLAVEHRHGH